MGFPQGPLVSSCVHSIVSPFEASLGSGTHVDYFMGKGVDNELWMVLGDSKGTSGSCAEKCLQPNKCVHMHANKSLPIESPASLGGADIKRLW